MRHDQKDLLFELFEKHHSLFAFLTRAETARIMSTLMGVDVSMHYIDVAEKATGLRCKRLGVPHPTENIPETASAQVPSTGDIPQTKDRVSVIAKVLIALMNELGCNVPEELVRASKHKRFQNETACEQHEVLSAKISDRKIGFSPRVINRLKSAGIETVRDLTAHTRSNLLRIPVFGESALTEVVTALRALGLSLKEDKHYNQK